MKEKTKQIVDFIIRNSIWLLMGLVALWLLAPGLAELQTLLFIVVLQSLALALSGISLFVYTKIPFIKIIMEGSDGTMNSVERHSIMTVLGSIFIGVHLLVGMVVLGVYIAQFAH